MDELTKEQLLAMLGSLEGFSAEDIRSQLDARQKAAGVMLATFREQNGIKAEVKTQ